MVKGMAFPVRVSPTGGVATSTVQPGDPAHIRESLRQLLFTRPGERVMRPTFGAGVESLVFSPNETAVVEAALHDLHRQVLLWEKRVEVTSAEVETLRDENLVLALSYRVKVSREEGQLVVRGSGLVEENGE